MELTLLAAVAMTAATKVVRAQATPFDGTGIINVITQQNENVGCLDAGMSFTADESLCALFDVVQTTVTNPVYGTQTTTYAISTSAGACGDPFQSGSQYEEGGNRILLCGPGSDANNSYWGVGGGDNDLIGLTLLVAANDDVAIFNTIDGTMPTGVEAKTLQQQLGENIAPGPGLSLTWTAK